MRKIFLSFIVFVLFFITAFSVDIKIPEKRDWINDFVGVLSTEDSKYLKNKLISLDEKYGFSVVVTIININENTIPRELAVEMYKKWGIGKKGEDKGLLILLALDEQQRQGKNKTVFEVGYGLEGILPDGKTGRIIRDFMTPDLKNKQYGTALKKGIDEVYNILTTDTGTDTQASDKKENSGAAGIIIALVVIVLIIICIPIAILSKPKCQRCGTRMSHVSSRTIFEATEVSEGQGVSEYICKKCGNRFEKIYTIPKKSSDNNISGGGGGSWGGGSSDSSDSNSDSSPFGGGESGGGGAEDSF